ncbi:MAG: hypothetical protein Athens071424_188 [Parcubacteria group bacterium Athens0714_24]|nr:MAG: hypothetical protein Athens071424_188 [Parcubacteria group bacterium Athens0714_24]
MLVPPKGGQVKPSVSAGGFAFCQIFDNIKNMKNKIILIAVIVLILVGGAGYYFWNKQAQQKINTEENSNTIPQNQNATTTESFDSLLQSGIYKKRDGDYLGAKNDWEAAARLNPFSSTPLNNLGDLYAYYLKDNQKAEYYFKLAVEKEPNMVYIFRSFYEFYKYVLKDDIKAKAVLQEGIKNNPDTSQDLKYLLDNY